MVIFHDQALKVHLPNRFADTVSGANDRIFRTGGILKSVIPQNNIAASTAFKPIQRITEEGDRPIQIAEYTFSTNASRLVESKKPRGRL